MNTCWLRLCLLGLLLGGGPRPDASAQGAPPRLRSLRAACRALQEPDRASRCTVERRMAHAGVHTAVLRITRDEGNSPTSLHLLVRGSSGWRALGPVGPPAYRGHGMYGETELVSLRVVGREGRRVVEARVRTWQGEPDGPCLRGPRQEHARVCVERPGGWACLGQTVASLGNRAIPGILDPPSSREACQARPSATWRVRLRVAPDSVERVPLEGTPPGETGPTRIPIGENGTPADEDGPGTGPDPR